MPASAPPPKIFISYSQKDRRWLQELKDWLAPYARAELLTVWDDTSIQPGQKWKDGITSAIASADIAILLVTPNFLASSFIANNELPPLLEDKRVFWIAVSASNYEITRIADYQAANSPSKPLNTLTIPKRNQEWVKICKKLFNLAPDSSVRQGTSTLGPSGVSKAGEPASSIPGIERVSSQGEQLPEVKDYLRPSTTPTPSHSCEQIVIRDTGSDQRRALVWRPELPITVGALIETLVTHWELPVDSAQYELRHQENGHVLKDETLLGEVEFDQGCELYLVAKPGFYVFLENMCEGIAIICDVEHPDRQAKITILTTPGKARVTEIEDFLEVYWKLKTEHNGKIVHYPLCSASGANLPPNAWLEDAKTGTDSIRLLRKYGISSSGDAEKIAEVSTAKNVQEEDISPDDIEIMTNINEH